jgi:hypothetical protein
MPNILCVVGILATNVVEGVVKVQLGQQVLKELPVLKV